MNIYNQYGDERTPEILKRLEDYHAFAVPIQPFTARAGEMLVNPAWAVECRTPEFRLCADDLGEFFRRMDCPLRPSGAGAAGTIRIARDDDAAEGRPHIDVRAGRVQIRARTLADAWTAVVWVEREMAWRHAPVLPAGEHVLTPRYACRITTSTFAKGIEDPADPLAYTDDYLRTMTHMGYTSFFLYIDLWSFCRSRLLPELASPRADANTAALRTLAERAARFGLKLVLMVNATRLPPDHAVFKRHPEIKGGTVMRTNGHALCTSAQLTRDFYAEQMADLCLGAPGLGGLAYLIGGEGFLHCYTRPLPRTERVTNCPACGQRSAPEVLVPLLNAVTVAVKDVSPATRVMFWPYTSFIWQKEPADTYDWRLDLEVIRGLDPRATWLAEIEKDGTGHIEGIGSVPVWDYSIQAIGPSGKIVTHAAALQARGMELAVKTETNVSVELHSLPYLPVMERWAARQRAIQGLGPCARVTWETWRFQGLWESPSAELVYWMNLHPEWSDDEALDRVAARLYGTAAVADVRQAWRGFSRAWDTSHPRYGHYWTGPMIMGPAHPFDIGGAFAIRGIYSDRFYNVFPSNRETDSERAIDAMKDVAPRFFFLPPRWPVERTRDYTHMARHWKEGLVSLRAALEKTPRELRPQAEADVDMAAMVGIYIEEDLAFCEFTRLRDTLTHMSPSEPGHRPMLEAMARLLEADVERCTFGLEIVRRNPFIGWGYTYGARTSVPMIEEKLSHTRALIETVRQRIATGQSLLM